MAWIEQLRKSRKYVAGEPLMLGGNKNEGKENVDYRRPFRRRKRGSWWLLLLMQKIMMKHGACQRLP